MYCNIIETYINFTEKNILEYLKMILEINYDKKIATELTKSYIDARYYNYGDSENVKTFNKKVFNSLKLQYERLKQKYPKKATLILETFNLFNYIFYIDGLKKDRTLEQVAKSVFLRRVKKYKIQNEEDKTFIKEFLKRLEDDNLKRKEYLKQFNTDKFELIIKKDNFMDNIFNVSIKSNVKFKDIFKDEAIERVFNKRINS